MDLRRADADDAEDEAEYDDVGAQDDHPGSFLSDGRGAASPAGRKRRREGTVEPPRKRGARKLKSSSTGTDFKELREGRLGLEHFFDSADLPSREVYQYIHHVASGMAMPRKIFHSSSLIALGVMLQEYCRYMAEHWDDDPDEGGAEDVPRDDPPANGAGASTPKDAP